MQNNAQLPFWCCSEVQALGCKQVDMHARLMHTESHADPEDLVLPPLHQPVKEPGPRAMLCNALDATVRRLDATD